MGFTAEVDLSDVNCSLTVDRDESNEHSDRRGLTVALKNEFQIRMGIVGIGSTLLGAGVNFQ
jgi:hypothetical protein